MSASLLRRAAKTLREHAEGATPGPWREDDEEDAIPGVWLGDPGTLGLDTDRTEDAAYLALMHPPVALALADWLDAAAEVVESNDANDGFDLDAIDDTYRGAVSTARAILREPPQTGAAPLTSDAANAATGASHDLLSAPAAAVPPGVLPLRPGAVPQEVTG